MLQTKTARWSALTALLCVAMLGIAWVLLVAPRRATAADIHAQAEQGRQANAVMETKVAELKAQFADLPRKRAELDAVRVQMPATAAMPEVVRVIEAAAASSGVTLVSLTPAAATELKDSAAAAPAPAPSPAASGAAGTTSGTAAGTTGSTGASSAGAGGLRVIAIPVTIVVDGSYFQSVLFLKKLQTDMPRVFGVGSLQVANKETKGSTTPTVEMTIVGNLFALPDAAETTPAGTGRGTSAGSSAGSSAGTVTTPVTGTQGSAPQGAAAGPSRAGTTTSAGELS